MACGCAPVAAGGGRLLAVAGLRNADAALAAFNAAMGNAPSEEVVDETPTSTIEETPTTVV
jgi:hypothetical protein